MKRCNICFLFMAIACVLFGTSCKKDDEKKTVHDEVMMPVAVATAYRGKINDKYSFTGRVIPLKTLEIVGRVSGFVITRNFDEGSYVEEGRELYAIEPYSYEYAVTQAEAVHKKAVATELNAKLEFARTTKLYEENVYSPETYDSARATYDSAVAQTRAAEAALNQAKLNYSYTSIKAPFSGWIGLTKTDVGNYINAPSSPLNTLLYIDKVRVEMNISDRYLTGELLEALPHGRMPDWPVNVLLPDGSEFSEVGKVTFWDNNLEQTTATLQLQALFDNPKRQLLPGMFVKAIMTNPVSRDVTLVDHRVLASREGSMYVMTVNANDILEYRKVEVGQESGNDTVILSGLEIGDRAVLTGNPMLRPGMKVRVVSDAKD